MIFIILCAATAVMAILLYFILLRKEKINRAIPLQSTNGKINLGDTEKEYFSSAFYLPSRNQIVFTKKGQMNKCVVSLITSRGGKKSIQRQVLTFGNDDKCAIQLTEPVSEMAIVLESVDKKIVKNIKTTKWLVPSIIYSSIIAALYAGTVIVYVVMSSTYLRGVFPAFGVYYALAAVGLAFPFLVILGSFYIDRLSRKGGF